MEKVIIYSAGGMAEKVAYSLDSEKFEVIAFMDRNIELYGKKYLFGCPIIAIADIVNWEYDLLLIATSMFEEEIRRQIKPYIKDESKVVTFLPNSNGIIWSDERWIVAKKCCNLIKERGVIGNIAEVGVYKGEFSKILNQCLPDRKLYLFDTFKGFDTRDTLDVEADKKRFKDTSVDKVLEIMPYPKQCIVRKGYFPETLGDLDEKFCFVSLDCDLYEPTIEGLKYFYPRLNRGGYIFVHDFGHNHYGGVRKAVMEFLDSEPAAAFVPVVDRGSTVILAR